jgi:diaminopimelate epimerase
MRFSKLQATGNDFILVDARTKAAEWPELAQAMCDRHFGVGADGLMLVQNSTSADFKMRLFNSDGSEAEISGNGLRCFAKYAVEKGLIGTMSSDAAAADLRMSIETLSGVRRIEARMAGNKVSRVEVNMGSPRFRPEQLPIKAKVDIIPILNYPLAIDRTKLNLSLVSMGNPHAVTFIAQPVANFPLAEIGPKVEMHTMFPRRTNFEAARVLSRTKIEARVWERGVGETLACGSGASAIAVVARLLDHVDTNVDIILAGGPLTVCWDGVGEVLLSGPVEEVFAGEWPEEGSLWN